MIGSALTCGHSAVPCNLPNTGINLAWVVLIFLTLVVLGVTLWRTSHK